MKPKTSLEKTIEGFEQSKLSYGDHINHSDIRAWCDIEVPDLNSMSFGEIEEAMDKYKLELLTVREGLKKHLLSERLMYLKTINGSGYLIVKPGQQTGEAVVKAYKYFDKGFKHMAKGTENVNVAMLTNQEREHNAFVSTKGAALKALLGRKKDLLKLIK